MRPEKKAYFDKKKCMNLLRAGDLSPEDAYARNAAGGRAAAEARKRRKTMREIARVMLETELCANDELRQELEERGFKDYTESAALILAQMNRARAGDTEAAKFLRDTSGQRPADQVAIGSFDDLPFESLNLSELPDEALLRLIDQRGGLDALSK